jgi:hypothetical protein
MPQQRLSSNLSDASGGGFHRTTISGNQVLCASPEGISEDLHLSRPFSVSAVVIVVQDTPGSSWLAYRGSRARTLRYVYTVQYSKWWNKTWSQNPLVVFPFFAQWRRAAENYLED